MCCVNLSFIQTVLSQRVLQVQLVRYENPYNLEVRPGSSGGQFCCCNQASPCYPTVQNFSDTRDCTTTCQLRFTICARINDSTVGEKCITSEVEDDGFPIISFSDKSSLFPDASSQLLLDFELEASFPNVSLYVWLCIYGVHAID